MGVLPLQFPDGETRGVARAHRRGGVLDHRLDDGEAKEVTVRAGDTEFTARVRIDTPKEVQYFQHGGILPFVLRQLLGRQVRMSGIPDVLRTLLTRPARRATRAAAAAAFRERACEPLARGPCRPTTSARPSRACAGRRGAERRRSWATSTRSA